MKVKQTYIFSSVILTAKGEIIHELTTKREMMQSDRSLTFDLAPPPPILLHRLGQVTYCTRTSCFRTVGRGFWYFQLIHGLLMHRTW